MAYNNLVSRSDASALIPQPVSNLMLDNVANVSASLNLFTQIPVSSAVTRFPVLSALPLAYFVSGDTGLKQTTEVNWADTYINVEELATIVPIPENVLDDADYDVWGSVQPKLEQAIGRALDDAVFFGTNKPGSWPAAIVPGAVAASNTVTRGTNAAAAGGLAGDVSDTFATVEGDGYVVTGAIANVSYMGRLRQARATDGQPLMNVDGNTVYGQPIVFPLRGQWPTGTGAAELIAGDFSTGIIGLRKDMTYKLLDQAIIQDGAGAIVYNLAQQDMVALRLTFRVGYAMANGATWDNASSSTRFPFGILRSP